MYENYKGTNEKQSVYVGVPHRSLMNCSYYKTPGVSQGSGVTVWRVSYVVLLGSYERPPCALEHAASCSRADVRSPKSVASPVVAMVI